MAWFIDWLLRRRRMTKVLTLPAEAESPFPGTGDPRLADLEAQAHQLLVAFEGICTDGLERLDWTATEEDESRLEVAERARWMNDAYAWAAAAQRRKLDTGGPYRDQSVQRVPPVLEQTAERVIEQLREDSAEGAASAIEQFLRSEPAPASGEPAGPNA